MSYTLHNGGAVPVIIPRFEQEETFTVEPGGTYETDNYRLALSSVDYGLRISKSDADAAHDEEQARQVREDAGGYVEPSPAGVSVTTPAVSDAADAADEDDADGDAKGDAKGDAGDLSELKGQALDDALDALSLSKAGTADEKRARLAEHLNA